MNMAVKDTPSLDPAEQSLPRLPFPPGTSDSHAHVCGPADTFPPSPDAAYPPPHAPVETYVEMLDRLGIARGVLVQATPYGFDNSAVLDALVRYPERLRGVALAGPDIPDPDLERMAQVGVKALRFAYFPPGIRDIGGVGLDQIEPLAARMRDHGMHPQLWAPCATTVEILPRLLAHGLPIVLDHMARVSPEEGIEAPAFRRLLDFVRAENVWVKLIPHRISRQHFHYTDLRPFHEAFIEAAPDRMLWGTDWPYVRMGDNTPDAGQLADLFCDWTSDESLRRKIFVDNPARLFGFADA